MSIIDFLYETQRDMVLIFSNTILSGSLLDDSHEVMPLSARFTPTRRYGY